MNVCACMLVCMHAFMGMCVYDAYMHSCVSTCLLASLHSICQSQRECEFACTHASM